MFCTRERRLNLCMFKKFESLLIFFFLRYILGKLKRVLVIISRAIGMHLCFLSERL